MAAEEGPEAVFDWNFEKTAELITLYEKFPVCMMEDRRITKTEMREIKR